MLTRIAGLLSFAAFLVLGIVWSSQSDPSGTLVTFWVISFALAALSALWLDLKPAQPPTAGALWDRVPGPSKDPADYR
jgi:hypothetical protein